MDKLQAISIIVLLMVISFMVGAELNTHYTKEQYKDYVLVQKTKSGVFYIKDDRIFSVSELQTEQQSNGVLFRK